MKFMKNQRRLKREFIKDRRNGDIPIFFVHNENGEFYYNHIRIGKIERIEEELMQRINLLPRALIDNVFDKSNN